VPEIAYGAVVPLPPDEAFAFVSDPTTWPLFFAGMRSAEPGSGWGAPGGHGRMVNRFIGKDVVSELELTEWDQPRAFRYTSRQQGRPDLDNRRTFTPVGGGTQLRGTTTLAPRPGLRGVGDRLVLRVLARVYARAMRELPAAARSQPR
jgi:hypothetical protein